MSSTFDSVYPDFLRAGLSKLSELGAHRELLTLFTALEHFRSDLQAQDQPAGILEVAQGYIAGLNLFHGTAFYMVNPDDMSFELTACSCPELRDTIDASVQREMQCGRFARALRQSNPSFFTIESPVKGQGLFHPMALANQVLGMFSGFLREDLGPARHIAETLLSVLLGISADALATLRKTAQMRHQIRTLSGLLPICAWCKKVRDDRGYWDQLEHYVHSRTDASFSHSICPDCKEKVLKDFQEIA